MHGLAPTREGASSARYGFRPGVPGDLPMLRLWLRAPEVRRWWGDPAEQAALVQADLADPRIATSIVSFDGQPFAYAQDYDVATWPQPHLAHLPQGSRAIDAFVGAPEMIGQGHGAAVLRLLARRLLADGAPVVAIDPHPDNQRARRAYARAGFRGERCVDSAEGPVVLMTMARR